MRCWIFQFNPDKFRWFDWIRENRPAEQWLVTRYALDIRRGDKVAIWATGRDAGIYAISEVITDPKDEPLNNDEEKYFEEKSYKTRFLQYKSVWIKHTKTFIETPLSKKDCLEDPILKKMQIFKKIPATNVKLSKTEWNRILELIERKVEEHSI